jgi:SNF2 family DNA or RNA helicase
MPGFLGNHASFVEHFQTPIMKREDKAALHHLRAKVSCFMLRRTKENVLKELPPKVEQIITCELENAQTVLYQEILANVKKTVLNTVEAKGFSRSHIHILAALTKLRQVCNHPALLLKSQDFRQYESAKLKVFEELIHEIIASERKVLVFSQFTSMLDILKSTLEEKSIRHFYLSGKTKDRQALVKKFQSDSTTQVFLISLKAGGTGLNLTAADNVIIFDPWWNPSVENQAIDRTHRIGQSKSVNVYRIIAKGTVEDKMLALQNRKKFLFDNLVGESNDLFQTLTWDDIKSLFE